MNIWLTMLIGGLITFGTRFSFIYLFGKFNIPETMRRALHYVPPAVLSAIIAPELLYPAKHFDLSLGNTRLLAGIIATLVAWYSKNTLLTILAGMVALVTLQLLLK
jgi:branched-subunit amino acid transport protein